MENYLDADLWTIFPNVKRVGVQVSGGADSALVLYTLVKCIIDADIYVITGSLNTENNFNEQYAKNVVAEVVRLTNTKSIKEHVFKRSFFSSIKMSFLFFEISFFKFGKY